MFWLRACEQTKFNRASWRETALSSLDFLTFILSRAPVSLALPKSNQIGISKKTLLLLHWFLCSIGLTGILYGLSWKLHAVLLTGQQAIAFHDWALPFFNGNKPQELIFIIAAGISLFLYYAVALFIISKGEERLTKSYTLAEYGSLKFLGLYIALPVSLNVIVFIGFPSGARPSIPVSGFLLGVVWLGILMFPFCTSIRQVQEGLWRVLHAGNACTQRWVWFYAVVGLLVFVCAQFIMVLLPYIRGELFMVNEYMDIPEYTRMGDHYVSNADYMRRHNFGGLLKYDPEIDRGNTPPPRPGTFIEVPRTDLLDRFIEKHKWDYHYDDRLGALVIHRAMLPDEHRELAMVLDQEKHQVRLDWLRYMSNDLHDLLLRGDYTAEEQDFLSKNQFELHWQILNRWVLHHHNFVLGPINEYALGKPLREINAQYGLFQVVMMRWLLEKTGGISYQNYFQKWYAWWLVYYALFVALAYLLLRNVYYVALVCVLVFGYLNQIDYQFLFLGPGLNPIRHFLDLPVMACLYGYLKTRRVGVLVLALLFGLIGVVNNKQFGVFLIGALVVTLLVKDWQERERGGHREVWWVVGAAVVLGLILLWGIPGRDIMSQYYHKGFLGFPTSSQRLYLIVFIISGCYLLLLRVERMANEWKYLALFLLLYSQGLLLYGIWGTDKHLLNISSVLVLSGVLFLKLVIDQSRLKRYDQVLVGALIVGALGFVYVPGLFAYYTTKSEYERVFATHRTYEWNLERAQFRSTMDPKYFVDSVSLIQQYANSENGIYIISKYDNLLPFLAKKYSAMPFFDVPWILLTENEVNLCIESIKTKKPPYLFVDTDIERNLNGEIVVTELPFVSNPGGESLLRVQRLNLLKDVFAAVKDDYELEMSRGLLTVYRRKVSGKMGKLP